MKAVNESAETELARLRKFQDEVFVKIDHYIAYYTSPKEFGVFRELRKDLWELKLKLWEKDHPEVS